MSSSFFSDQNPQECGDEVHIENDSNRLWVLCTRPRGHRDTGHEFAGSIGGQHVHIVWGEPTEGLSRES